MIQLSNADLFVADLFVADRERVMCSDVSVRTPPQNGLMINSTA
jgi:hypothetical protein